MFRKLLRKSWQNPVVSLASIPMRLLEGGSQKKLEEFFKGSDPTVFHTSSVTLMGRILFYRNEVVKNVINYHCLAVLCDLFGMVKCPFGKVVGDLQ